MKSRKKTKILCIVCLFLINSLSAEENQRPQYEWVEGNEVAVCEDGIYIETNKGLMRLNVVEYDRGNDRYLVKHTFKKGLYGVEELGYFSEEAE